MVRNNNASEKGAHKLTMSTHNYVDPLVEPNGYFSLLYSVQVSRTHPASTAIKLAKLHAMSCGHLLHTIDRAIVTIAA